MDLHELEALAKQKLAEHGLAEWSFRFGRSKRRLGCCHHREKCIEIAAYYAYFNPEESVRDTLFHEIAHALAGPAAGHGPKWKAVARQIGATPRACDTSPDTIVPPGDWQTTCPACQKTFFRYRRPASLSGFHCRCAAKSPLTFTFRGQPVPERAAPTPRWQATCSGCGVVHRRVRRPKSGLWRCGCRHKCPLTWASAH
jgi:predicted SprT family Zn-dependent metalloprotease